MASTWTRRPNDGSIEARRSRRRWNPGHAPRRVPADDQPTRSSRHQWRRSRHAVSVFEDCAEEAVSLLRSVPETAVPAYNRGLASFRRAFRSSEAALILLAVVVGLAAGLLMIAQHAMAHGMQSLIYGLSGASLSAAPSVATIRLFALPIFGLLLGLASRAVIRRWRAPVD